MLYAADVGDVFALRQLAVDVQTGERLVVGILLHDLVGALLDISRPIPATTSRADCPAASNCRP